MMNRRVFVGTSATTVLAAKLSWALPAEHKIKAVGLQLYTVRGAMKSDFEGTLAKVGSEEITTTESERETEKQHDLQSTERNEMQNEANKTVQSQSQLEAGLQVSGSYGPTVSFSASELPENLNRT